MSLGTVGIIGGGMVGCGWASAFARAGCAVRLFDDEASARAGATARIGAILEELERGGVPGTLPVAEAMARVDVVATLSDAASDVGYVQECVPEDPQLKADVMVALGELADDRTVLASSTSGIVPSSFTAQVRHRERCLVAHPINPVHLHRTVEVVPAPWTAPSVVDATVELLGGVGFQPARLNRETDGFLVNRLQSALLHEAFRLVADGVATAAEVDSAVRGALAPRWLLLGPFETIDLNAPDGVRDYVERYESMYQRIGASQTVPADWTATLDRGLEAERRALVPADQLDDRRRWRDHELLQLATRETTRVE